MIRIASYITSLLILTSFANSKGTLELHSHAFMKPGLGHLFKGDFEGELRAKSWKNKLSSQVNAEELRKSDIKIMVIALYSHPILSAIYYKKAKDSARIAIRHEIEKVNNFVTENSEWVIAKNSKEASENLKLGKKIIILSLEGAHSVLETEDDLKEFIDEKKISIVTFTHLVNSKFAGAAYMKGILESIGTTRIFTCNKSEGVPANPKGLSKNGEWLANELIKRKVWIDLTHSSDQTQKELIPKLIKAKQPLLFTHTVLRKYYQAERGLAEWQIQLIKKHGGFVGIIPGEDMLKDNRKVKKQQVDCDDSLSNLVTQYNELQTQIGNQNISLGSDFNGGIRHLKMPSCDTHTSLDTLKGLWRIGQTPDIWSAMNKYGAQLPAHLDLITNSFLKSWDKVR